RRQGLPARGARRARGARERARRGDPPAGRRQAPPGELRYPRNVTSRRFALPGFRGEAAESFAVADLAAEATRLADPAAATKTIHWGRNYLSQARVATASGPLDVVVKQFRPATGWRARIGWHLAGREGKAARSWRI